MQQIIVDDICQLSAHIRYHAPHTNRSTDNRGHLKLEPIDWLTCSRANMDKFESINVTSIHISDYTVSQKKCIQRFSVFLHLLCYFCNLVDIMYTVFRKKHPLTFSFISPWVMCRLKQKTQWIYPKNGRFWQLIK